MMKKYTYQTKGERADWERQAGPFWDDANDLQHDGFALPRCIHLSKLKTHPIIHLAFMPFRTLMVCMLKCLGMICTDACNLLHTHTS